MTAAGGQSRLVGNGSPESVTVPGEQETAGQIPEPGQTVLSGHTVTPGVQLVTSLAPPLHLLVVALQIGQGCTWAVSLTHEPTAPPQLASLKHMRPTSMALVVPAPHRLNMRSPVRNVAAESGTFRSDAPADTPVHVKFPLAFADSVFRTQTLSDELGLMTGTGGP